MNVMSEIKPDKIEMDDFAVVNFMSTELQPEVEAWRETARVCAAQSCARQTWFGSYSEALNTFPIDAIRNDKIDFLRGKEAYLFMLRMKLGLETQKTVAETNICGQMNEGWRVFQEQLPMDAGRLRPIYDSLIADARLIRGKILDNQFITPTLANAANRLSQKEQRKVVTIIAHGERNGGSLSEDTIDLIKRFAAVKKNFASTLFILAANDAIKSLVEKTITEYRQRKFLHEAVVIQIKKATSSNLQSTFNESSLVFCAKPMAAPDSPDVRLDDDMILAWVYRSKPKTEDEAEIKGEPELKGKFIHLRGVPQDRGASSKLWRNFGLVNYHSPENVANEQAVIHINNERVLGVAGNNASIFARLRSRGVQPGKKHLSLV